MRLSESQIRKIIQEEMGNLDEAVVGLPAVGTMDRADKHAILTTINRVVQIYAAAVGPGHLEAVAREEGKSLSDLVLEIRERIANAVESALIEIDRDLTTRSGG